MVNGTIDHRLSKMGDHELSLYNIMFIIVVVFLSVALYQPTKLLQVILHEIAYLFYTMDNK